MNASDCSPISIVVDPQHARKYAVGRRLAAGVNGTPRLTADPAYEDTMGIMGEIAFGQWSGLTANLVPRPSGDGGFDFSITVAKRTLTIDVKTSRKPLNLLLKCNSVSKCADILVFSHVLEMEVRFLGWEHKSMMLISPVDDFGYGFAMRCHYRHNTELRPMWQLKKLIERSKEET
jgi:hypothetical protein